MLKKSFINLSLFIFLSSSSLCHAASNLTTAGDILQIAVPVSAFGVTTYKKDGQGQKQFAISFLTTMGVTYATKLALRNSSWGKRPHGGRDSFPSGHTASAFGGAFFLQKRYGSMYGVPAIAAAAFTGYTRVKGRYHHWRDIIGATAIAGVTNYFLVTKYEKVNLAADLDKTTAMLSLDMKL